MRNSSVGRRQGTSSEIELAPTQSQPRGGQVPGQADGASSSAMPQSSGLGNLSPRRQSAEAGPSGQAAAASGDQPHVAVDIGQPQGGQAPAGSAAELQQKFKAVAGGAGTPAQELDAFQANMAYSNDPQRKWDAATATLNSAANVGGVSALTFGTGRPLANPAATYGALTGNAAADGALSVLGTTAGGTVGNMVAQTVVPPLANAAFPKKLVPVPPEALVPRTGEELTRPQQELRQNIKDQQATLARVGDPQNAATGGGLYAAAQAARLGGEAGVDKAAGIANWGATAAVSGLAGAAFGGTMAGRQALAKVEVPDPRPGGGDPVHAHLFQPAPVKSGLASPPWLGTGAEVAESAAMRAGNLLQAGGQLQVAASLQPHLPPAANVALGAGTMFTGAGSYFVLNQKVGEREAARHRPAQQPQPQPADQGQEAVRPDPGSVRPDSPAIHGPGGSLSPDVSANPTPSGSLSSVASPFQTAGSSFSSDASSFHAANSSVLPDSPTSSTASFHTASSSVDDAAAALRPGTPGTPGTSTYSAYSNPLFAAEPGDVEHGGDGPQAQG